ncbi:MAG: hypothetical protein II685_07185 [Clostridia bacterium]|nr:hypothetical protein [Clostridia bacterium]
MTIGAFCLFFLLDEQEKLREVARKTDMVTFILLGLVVIVIVILTIYLIWFQQKYKRPKRSQDRYNNYQNAEATITDIEKVSYFVKPYVPVYKDKEVFEREFYAEEYGGSNSRYVKKTIKDDRYSTFNRDYKLSPDEPPKDIEKFRYNVRYEFSVGSPGNVFYGKCFVYEENDDIKVGKTIGIKYDPSNPMVNFTSYSSPVGAD